MKASATGANLFKVVPDERQVFTLNDGRKVIVTFTDSRKGVPATEAIEPENKVPLDMLHAGW